MGRLSARNGAGNGQSIFAMKSHKKTRDWRGFFGGNTLISRENLVAMGHYEGEEAEIRQLTFRYVSCLIPWVRTGLDALRKVVKTNT